MIDSIDHIVLTVRDLEKSIEFYGEFLEMEVRRLPKRPVALHFGGQKMHLHELGAEFVPNADPATPGSGDICFLTRTPVEEWKSRAEASGIEVVLGPVRREGAQGPINSLYLRDPDHNLIELANSLDGSR